MPAPKTFHITVTAKAPEEALARIAKTPKYCGAGGGILIPKNRHEDAEVTDDQFKKLTSIFGENVFKKGKAETRPALVPAETGDNDGDNDDDDETEDDAS